MFKEIKVGVNDKVRSDRKETHIFLKISTKVGRSGGPRFLDISVKSRLQKLKYFCLLDQLSYSSPEITY